MHVTFSLPLKMDDGVEPGVWVGQPRAKTVVAGLDEIIEATGGKVVGAANGFLEYTEGLFAGCVSFLGCIDFINPISDV